MLKELNKIGEELVERTQKNLKKKKKITSGALYDSIRYEIVKEGDSVFLEFWMFEYGYYQDEGVRGLNPEGVMVNGKKGRQKAPNSRFRFGSGKGKGSLFKAIDKWIVRKRLDKRKNGKFTSRDSIRYALTKSIFAQGIEPSGFFTEAYDQTMKNVDKRLADDLSERVQKLYFELIL
jgi:hypothetical protein